MASRQMTLEDKSLLDHNIQKTKSILKDYNKDNKLLIGFSGGKDSTVMLDIALKTLPKEDVYVIFHDTKIEFKETLDFVDYAINDYFEIDDEFFFRTTPVKTFWDELETRNNILKWVAKWRDCCYWLKKIPLDNVIEEHNFDFALSGVRKYESNARMGMGIESHFKVDSKNVDYWILNPMFHWTDQNIDDYVDNNNIPLNDIYSMGYDRCGCSICPCPNKTIDYYSRLYENHPLFYKAIKRRSCSKDGDSYEVGDTFYRHTWKEVEDD